MLFPLESTSHLHDPNSTSLGPEYIINDAGEVSPVESGPSFAPGGGSAGGGGKDTGGSSPSSPSSPSTPSTPTATLVSAAGSNLEIDLIWDSSVASAPTGFTTAITDAAQYYVSNFTSATGAATVLYIDVGYGEIAGTTPLAATALGESESLGYLTNYSAVTSALAHNGYNLSFSASNEPTTAQFFITSAQAKTLGLIGGTSGGATSVDGYIGFSNLTDTGVSWNLYANANGSNSETLSNQYDLQAVAQHELSEVMGRIGMEGEIVNGKPTYTLLDLFNYASYNTANNTGSLVLSGAGGYFSANGGASVSGAYNNAVAYGGDIADWASYSSPSQSGTLPAGSPSNLANSYNAFLGLGENGYISQADLLEDWVIGYHSLTPISSPTPAPTPTPTPTPTPNPPSPSTGKSG